MTLKAVPLPEIYSKEISKNVCKDLATMIYKDHNISYNMKKILKQHKSPTISVWLSKLWINTSVVFLSKMFNLT